MEPVGVAHGPRGDLSHSGMVAGSTLVRPRGWTPCLKQRETGRTGQTATAACSAVAAWPGLRREKAEQSVSKASLRGQLINCYRMVINYFHCTFYSVNESPLPVSWRRHGEGSDAPRLGVTVGGAQVAPWCGRAVFSANTTKDKFCCTLPRLFPWVDPRPLLYADSGVLVLLRHSLGEEPRGLGTGGAARQGLLGCSRGACGVVGVALGQGGKGDDGAKGWLEAHGEQDGPARAVCCDCMVGKGCTGPMTRPELPGLFAVLADGCCAGSRGGASAKCPSVARAVPTALPILHPGVHRGEEEMLVATLDAASLAGGSCEAAGGQR